MKNRLLPVIFVLAGALAAAEAPLIRVDDPITKPKVEETGALLEIEAKNNENLKGTPTGVLAGLIADRDKHYEWIPSTDTTVVSGGADFLDAQLSPDESVLTILERIGGAGKFNSSRLVFVNLLNEKIIRAITIGERRLTAFDFVPGEAAIIAVQAAQKENEQPDKLLKINIRAGQVTSESSPLKNPVRSVAVNASHCFIVCEKEDFCSMYPTDNLRDSPQKLRTLIPDARVALSPSGRTLLLYGQKRYELFRVSGGTCELLASREFDLGTEPSWGMVADDGNMVVLAAPSGKALLFAGGVVRVLEARSSGIGAYRPSDRKLLLGAEKNDSLSLYTLPASADAEQTVSPGGLRPHTRFRNFRVFFLSTPDENEMILIDRRGNISQLQAKERRWQKKLVFAAPK